MQPSWATGVATGQPRGSHGAAQLGRRTWASGSRSGGWILIKSSRFWASGAAGSEPVLSQFWAGSEPILSHRGAAGSQPVRSPFWATWPSQFWVGSEPIIFTGIVLHILKRKVYGVPNTCQLACRVSDYSGRYIRFGAATPCVASLSDQRQFHHKMQKNVFEVVHHLRKC